MTLLDSADLALVRQAQRHIAAALEAVPGDLLAAVAALSGAQAVLATMEMRHTAGRYPLAASS